VGMNSNIKYCHFSKCLHLPGEREYFATEEFFLMCSGVKTTEDQNRLYIDLFV